MNVSPGSNVLLHDTYAPLILNDQILNEKKYQLPQDFLKQGSNNDTKILIRDKVIQWKFDVFQQLQISMKTKETSVVLFDRILAQKSIQKEKLQLVASLCMKLSINLYETFEYKNEYVIVQCGGLYTLQQIQEMESQILSLLNWNLVFPLASDIVRLILQIWGDDSDLQNSELFDYLDYFTELCIQEYSLCTFKPSTQALSILMCAFERLNLFDQRDSILQKIEQYDFISEVNIFLFSIQNLQKDEVDKCRKLIYDLILDEYPEYFQQINPANIIKLCHSKQTESYSNQSQNYSNCQFETNNQKNVFNTILSYLS